MVWHREFDETYQTEYFYNDETQESSWEPPAAWRCDDGRSEGAGLVSPTGLEMEVDDDEEDDVEASGVRHRGSYDEESDDESDASDEADEMLSESRFAAGCEKVRADTEPVMRASARRRRRAGCRVRDGPPRYTCIFFFHACLCEGPFAAIEAAVRSLCYLAMARPRLDARCFFSFRDAPPHA